MAAVWDRVLDGAGPPPAAQSMATEPEQLNAKQLYQWLEEKDKGDIVDYRTMRRPAPSALRDKKALEQIVGVLVEYGLLEPVTPGDPVWRVYRGY